MSDQHRAKRLHDPRRQNKRSFPPFRRIKIGQREIITHGIAPAVLQDLYHYFMTVGWLQLFGTIAAFFLIFDTLFGFLYFLVPGCIANLSPPGFAGAFFFSVETLATVGYGDMHPQTLYGHIVSMFEIFVGLMSLALITGIMFARFSRPKARFLFAKHAVVRPIDGSLTLMFRVANARQNVVQGASAQLHLLRDEVTEEGLRIRRIRDLSLVRAEHPMFVLGWNIMHIIDDSSPLKAANEESLRASAAIVVLSISGADETTGQVLMARAVYSGSAIRWNEAFRDITEKTEDGALHFDYGKFDDVVPLAEWQNENPIPK
jgi:inward rectifier potassium channel